MDNERRGIACVNKKPGLLEQLRHSPRGEVLRRGMFYHEHRNYIIAGRLRQTKEEAMFRDTYQKIVEKLPRYPLLEEAIRSSGLTNGEIAKHIHVNPARFEANLKGTNSKCGEFGLGHIMSLKELLGAKSLNALLYTPVNDLSPTLETAMERAAAALDDGWNIDAFEAAFEVLGDFEKWQMEYFFRTILIYAQKLCAA